MENLKSGQETPDRYELISEISQWFNMMKSNLTSVRAINKMSLDDLVNLKTKLDDIALELQKFIK